MIERWTPKIKKSLTAEGMELRMWTDKEGDYVLYKDYQQLESRLTAARKGLMDLANNPSLSPKGNTQRTKHILEGIWVQE